MTGRLGAVALAGVVGVLVAVVAPAFACAPISTIHVSQPSAIAGSTVEVRGDGFAAGTTSSPVELQWSALDGRDAVRVGEVPGPTFRLMIRVPYGTNGNYAITATQRRLVDGAITARTTVVLRVDPGPPPSPTGYRLVASDGGIFAYGDASFFGSMGGKPLNRPIVGMAATPSGNGYWEMASDGGIFAFGDAGFFGSMGGKLLNRPIVGMAATPSGNGYWLVASDGGIFAFGDARYVGSTGGMALAQPVVDMARTASGRGYWLLASDGGVFSFGDAVFLGSTGGVALGAPIVGIAGTTQGYWLVDARGGVFPFGEVSGRLGVEPFDRGLLTHPVVGFEPVLDGRGYWLATSDGGIFAAFDAPFLGSAGGLPLLRPIVGITPTRG